VKLPVKRDLPSLFAFSLRKKEVMIFHRSICGFTLFHFIHEFFFYSAKKCKQDGGHSIAPKTTSANAASASP